MHILYRNAFVFLASGIILCAGCAASSSPATQADPGREDMSYSNILVIAVAKDYNARTQFERQTASELKQRRVAASPYHSIISGNQPITAEDVRAAMETGNFDSVLVTRVIDSQRELEVNEERTETGAAAIGGGLVNLFRYDYTDYANPGSIDLQTTVTLASELYSATSEEIVWSMEQTSKGEISVGVLIDKTAAAVVNRLRRDDVIGR